MIVLKIRHLIENNSFNIKQQPFEQKNNKQFQQKTTLLTKNNILNKKTTFSTQNFLHQNNNFNKNQQHFQQKKTI